MGTLGEDLKAARESKGITLREISERTRISVTFLKAIEEEDYSVIPGDVFVTGFLRTYAKELGLKEKEILARYKDTRPPQEEQTAPQQPEKPQKTQHMARPSVVSFRRGEKEKGFPLGLIILGGLVLAAIPAIISLYLTKGKPTAPPVPPVAQVAPVKKPMSSATTAFKQATSFKSRTTAAAKPKPPSPTPAQAPAAAGPLKIKLTATENTWYAVRKDNGRKESAILNRGETATFDAKDRIVLDLGNAGGVKVDFNGRPLKPYGKHGEAVKGITFTHETR